MHIDITKLEELKKQLQKDEEEKCRRLLEARRQKVTGDTILKGSNPGNKPDTKAATRRRELPEEVRARIYESMQGLKRGKSGQELRFISDGLLSYGSEAITPIIMWIPTVDHDLLEVKQVLVHVISDLVRSDEQAREVMLDLLEKGVPVVKKILCAVCSQIMAYDARDILVQLTKDQVLYYDACCTLIDLRVLDVLPDILEAIERVNTEVKSERELAWDVMKRVSRLGEKAVSCLIQQYVLCKKRSIRFMYTDALVRIGDVSIPMLGELLEHPEYCREVATVLGKMKNAAAIDCLLNALEKDKGERRWILHGLSRSMDERCIDIFKKMLKINNLTLDEKSEIILALGNMVYRDPGLYKRYLGIKEKGLYLDAAMALAQIGQESGFSLLISVLISGPDRDRSRAITHLGRLKGEAVKRILPILEVESNENSVYLVQALNRTIIINDDIVANLTKRLTMAYENLRLEIYRYFAGHAEAVREESNGDNDQEKNHKKKWNKKALDVLYKGRQIEKSRAILEFLNKSIESATKDSRGITNINYRKGEEK